MKGELSGGCLCGAVRYVLREGFRLNPYACHCTDCQSRTGSAFSEHMLFALADLEISGELDVGEYVQPSGAHSRISGCAICKSRIYAVNGSQEGLAAALSTTAPPSCPPRISGSKVSSDGLACQRMQRRWTHNHAPIASGSNSWVSHEQTRDDGRLPVRRRAIHCASRCDAGLSVPLPYVPAGHGRRIDRLHRSTQIRHELGERARLV